LTVKDITWQCCQVPRKKTSTNCGQNKLKSSPITKHQKKPNVAGITQGWQLCDLGADYRPTHSWSTAAATELVRYVIVALSQRLCFDDTASWRFVHV